MGQFRPCLKAPQNEDNLTENNCFQPNEQYQNVFQLTSLL